MMMNNNQNQAINMLNNNTSQMINDNQMTNNNQMINNSQMMNNNQMMMNNNANQMMNNNMQNQMMGNNMAGQMMGNNMTGQMMGNNMQNQMMGNMQNMQNSMMGNNMPNQMMMTNMQNQMMGNNMANQMMLNNMMIQNNLMNNQMLGNMNNYAKAQISNMNENIIKSSNYSGSSVATPESSSSKGLNVVFRASGQGAQNTPPLTIQCTKDEKVKDLIERYRSKSGDRDKHKKFIFNAKNLELNMTVGEAGITNNGNIFVVSTHGVKGA